MIAAFNCNMHLLIGNQELSRLLAHVYVVGGVNYRGKMTDIILVIRTSRRGACDKLFLPETRVRRRSHLCRARVIAKLRGE